VVAKFFHDTYKKRDSAETLIDAALGKVVLTDDSPTANGGSEDIRITVAVHGGKGSIRQGIIRKLVVRFELADGLHIYGAPVPEGMVATEVTVKGPPGFATQDAEMPPTERLHLDMLDTDLGVWSGTVDIVVPFYAKGELASETRPLDADEILIEVQVRYQACTDSECLLPQKETFTLNLPMDVIDVPGLGLHKGHGQREGSYSSAPALRRLMFRKIRQNPLSLPKYLWKNMRLERAARKRLRQRG
jgi:DsbC/DsbD-like thiol-disulfide interchange protein|tara:strand:+ start:1142 stop:1879 length:738 start_codon:yes stop_codon:yes gene_type:complete